MTLFVATELKPKTVAKAFWVGEVEHELSRLGRQDFRFHADEDLEKCMEMIEDIHRQSIYPHPESVCSTECQLSGAYTTRSTITSSHSCAASAIIVLGT